MKSLLRHLILISISAAASWWFFLYQPHEVGSKNPEPETFVMALTPVIDAEPMAKMEEMQAPDTAEPDPPAEEAEAEAEAQPEPEPIAEPEPVAEAEPELEAEVEPESEPEIEPEPEPAHAAEAAHHEEPESELEEAPAEVESETGGPPPAEAGTPDGTEEGENPAETPNPTEETEGGILTAAAAMSDANLLKEAEQEISGAARKGFQSIFLASPEEQLNIGKFFNELVVLVPKSAIDPNNANPQYFRIALGSDTPKVERVLGRPPLEQYRQYRDLFSYPYNKLPDVVRELRRSVLARNEVFLFAALIPPSEWALTIDRRRRALAESGRDLTDVKQFVLRYVRSASGSYDIQVDAIHFADGSKIVPTARPL
jgi:outer membrane biosynthesis protein TonB